MEELCTTLEGLAEKLQQCMECNAFNQGLAVNIQLKITRLEILAKEMRDIELQMEHLQQLRSLKLAEIDEFENSVTNLRAQLISNDCGSV